MNKLTKGKEILTTKELAKYLNLHPFTIHRYAREGKIPGFKIGCDWRFHRKYIKRWIKQRISYSLKDKKNNNLFNL